MLRALLFPCFLLALLPGLLRGEDGQVAVAIRYLQITGVSHAHVYLYGESGKLLRQLTASNEGQDHDPVFSPDGKVIVFARQMREGEQWWEIQTDGSASRHLDAPPDWHATRQPADFAFPPAVAVPNHPGERRLVHTTKAGELPFPAPDKSVTLVLKDDPQQVESENFYYGKVAYLRRDGMDQAIEEMPAVPFRETGPPAEREMRKSASPAEGEFSPAPTSEIRYDNRLFDFLLLRDGSPFLFAESLRVAFFAQHRGSSDGTGMFALDLARSRSVELTPNGSRLVPAGDKPYFFSICSERYLPLGDGKRTVNCTFLDRWDATLQRVRFAAPKVSIFHGACARWPDGARVVLPWENAEE